MTDWLAVPIPASDGVKFGIAILLMVTTLVIAVVPVVCVAIVTSVFSFHFLINPNTHDHESILVVFATSIALSMVTFHILAFNFGRILAAADFGRWSVLSRQWPKAIDYVYYTVSALSAFKLALQLHFLMMSGSMGSHDSESDDWRRVDRGYVVAVGGGVAGRQAAHSAVVHAGSRGCFGGSVP